MGLVLDNLPIAAGNAKLTRYVIDADHGNSYAAWLKMGSPLQLSDERYLELEKGGKLAALGSEEEIRVQDGKAQLRFCMPRQAVSLIVLTWM